MAQEIDDLLTRWAPTAVIPVEAAVLHRLGQMLSRAAMRDVEARRPDAVVLRVARLGVLLRGLWSTDHQPREFRHELLGLLHSCLAPESEPWV